MVELGERFLFGTEIVGALLIGCIFIFMAYGAKPDLAWKMIIAAVLCFCFALFFGLMYITSSREREKKKYKI